MAPGMEDPRMTAIHPRIRYNTIGGVNGPLVILENVELHQSTLRSPSDADISIRRSNFLVTMRLSH